MKSLRGRRREGFQRQYPMWNCLWLPSKWKVISAVDSSIKCKRIGMEEGIMPTKSLQTGWRRETFQAQHPMWNCSWLPWKEIIISAMGTNMKCEKAWMEDGNNAHQIFMSWVKESYIPNTISYGELFMTPSKIKNNFCDGHQ